MEIKDIRAMTKAITGEAGYNGTLKGRFKSGSLFRNLSNEIMERMYKVSAPNTEMVMISTVLPVHKAKMPISILISKAFTGV